MESQLDVAIEEAVEVIFTTDSPSLIHPVKVAQLLYSEICISETTLDKMEISESPLDEKKTTLLTAIQTTVSSDYKKIRIVAAVLSKFEKTKDLSDRINNIYAQLSPVDVGILDYEIAITDFSSREDHASHILRCHYYTLSQSLHNPAYIAQVLSSEISGMTQNIPRSNVQSASEDLTTFLLLKAVRQAVHTDYHNLEVFASVLLKFSSVHCAVAILNEYAKEFCSPLPNVSDIFETMRTKFDTTFGKIQEAIISSPPPIDELQQFLANSYNYTSTHK